MVFRYKDTDHEHVWRSRHSLVGRCSPGYAGLLRNLGYYTLSGKKERIRTLIGFFSPFSVTVWQDIGNYLMYTACSTNTLNPTKSRSITTPRNSSRHHPHSKRRRVPRQSQVHFITNLRPIHHLRTHIIENRQRAPLARQDPLGNRACRGNEPPPP